MSLCVHFQTVMSAECQAMYVSIPASTLKAHTGASVQLGCIPLKPGSTNV